MRLVLLRNTYNNSLYVIKGTLDIGLRPSRSSFARNRGFMRFTAFTAQKSRDRGIRVHARVAKDLTEQRSSKRHVQDPHKHQHRRPAQRHTSTSKACDCVNSQRRAIGPARSSRPAQRWWIKLCLKYGVPCQTQGTCNSILSIASRHISWGTSERRRPVERSQKPITPSMLLACVTHQQQQSNATDPRAPAGARRT